MRRDVVGSVVLLSLGLLLTTQHASSPSPSTIQHASFPSPSDVVVLFGGECCDESICSKYALEACTHKPASQRQDKEASEINNFLQQQNGARLVCRFLACSLSPPFPSLFIFTLTSLASLSLSLQQGPNPRSSNSGRRGRDSSAGGVVPAAKVDENVFSSVSSCCSS